MLLDELNLAPQSVLEALLLNLIKRFYFISVAITCFY